MEYNTVYDERNGQCWHESALSFICSGMKIAYGNAVVYGVLQRGGMVRWLEECFTGMQAFPY